LGVCGSRTWAWNVKTGTQVAHRTTGCAAAGASASLNTSTFIREQTFEMDTSR